MARENSSWGYDRIVRALAHLRHDISDQTVANILKRHGIAPAPKRSQTTTWKDFIRAHMAVLAGVDFFTRRGSDLARPGNVLCSVLHSPCRPPSESGWITRHPTEEWMVQAVRDGTGDSGGIWRTAGTCYTTETRSSAPPSEIRFAAVASSRSPCRREVRT
jgi:hypothetical protein